MEGEEDVMEYKQVLGLTLLNAIFECLGTVKYQPALWCGAKETHTSLNFTRSTSVGGASGWGVEENMKTSATEESGGLHEDVWPMIFDYLDDRSMCRLAGTCRRMYAYVGRDRMWKQRYCARFHAASCQMSDAHIILDFSWKEVRILTGTSQLILMIIDRPLNRSADRYAIVYLSSPLYIFSSFWLLLSLVWSVGFLLIPFFLCSTIFSEPPRRAGIVYLVLWASPQVRGQSNEILSLERSWCA
tara:strand:- start:295 stop:1026 length:732 start_codon:yes stop_codon:yes gene_type:complete